jgi:hypothetical protein
VVTPGLALNDGWQTAIPVCEAHELAWAMMEWKMLW